MTFEDIAATLPFTPSTEQGRGFLPPMTRAIGHLLYLLGRISDTPTRRPTDNQITEEISAIQLHFTEFTVPDFMTENTTSYVNNFKALLDSTAENLVSWDEDTRKSNLTILNNRAIEVMKHLDREILGITDSDAGQNL